jgi:hypothetical protein
MVFLVESTKSIKPIQHLMELPENLIPVDENFSFSGASEIVIT